jgi:hypothetical protein
VRPFVYFHLAAGARRVVVDGVEPMDCAGRLHPVLHVRRALPARRSIADAETLGMEICLPVWKYRDFIDAHRYDHCRGHRRCCWSRPRRRGSRICLARKVATGDIGATANTILVMGSERVRQRMCRMLSRRQAPRQRHERRDRRVPDHGARLSFGDSGV